MAPMNAIVPVFLFVACVFGLAIGLLAARGCQSEAAGGRSSGCPTKAAWTRSMTPGAGSTSASTCWRSPSWCSTWNCCSSIPGRWRRPAALPRQADGATASGHREPARTGIDAAVAGAGREPGPGLCRGDGLRRPVGARVRLRLAQGGFPMAVGTARQRGGHAGWTSWSVGAGRTASGRCPSPRPAAASS